MSQSSKLVFSSCMLPRVEVENGITDKICCGIFGIFFKSKARVTAITR